MKMLRGELNPMLKTMVSRHVMFVLTSVVMFTSLISLPVLAVDFKSGVNENQLKYPITDTFQVLDQIHQEVANRDAIITGGVEERSLVGSLHPEGLAIDLRTRDLHVNQALSIVRLLRQALGDCYDVILESNHIHIEYDEHNGRCSDPYVNNSFDDFISYTRAVESDLHVIHKLLTEAQNEFSSKYASGVDNGRSQFRYGIHREDASNEDGTTSNDVQDGNTKSQPEYGVTLVDPRYGSRAREVSMDPEVLGNHNCIVYRGSSETGIPTDGHTFSVYVCGDHK